MTTREHMIRLRYIADAHNLAMPPDAESRIAHLPANDALWDAQRALLLWAPETAEHTVALGRLSLHGELLHTPGILAMLQHGVKRAIVPFDNRVEASFGAAPACAAHNVTELLQIAGDPGAPQEHACSIEPKAAAAYDMEPGNLRAAMRPIVDAGLGERSNLRVLLTGPLGCGKTMLARWMHSQWLLPSPKKLMEASVNYSLAGLLSRDRPIIDSPPFRAPHCTVSEAGLFGASGRMGELDLACGGVLFLDELPEFRVSILKRLAHRIRAGALEDVGIVGGMNPCPCGYRGHPKRECRCSEKSIEFWLRTSDIVRSLFDVEVTLPPMDYAR